MKNIMNLFKGNKNLKHQTQNHLHDGHINTPCFKLLVKKQRYACLLASLYNCMLNKCL